MEMQELAYLEFQCRTKIVHAPHALYETGPQLANIGVTRPFFVADPIVTSMGWREALEESLREAGVEMAGWFDEIPPNSEIKTVERCAEMAKEARSDGFVGMGGGSTLDTMKCANILVTKGGDLLSDHQGAYTLQEPLLPMVGIPTTAGTGSEVSFAAVIRDEEQKLKISFVSPFLATQVAILDPEVIVKLPSFLTAATGMDALTHGIEALHSTQSQPFSDALALHAIRLIGQNLLLAVQEPENREARSGMLIAAAMAGIAFSHALVGIVHAMAHALGGITGAHHGALNACLLPSGMEFNLPTSAAKYKLVAEALGLPVQGCEEREAALQAIAYIRELNKKIGLPTRLQALGVKREWIERGAQDTLTDGAILTNPREASVEEVKAILEGVF